MKKLLLLMVLLWGAGGYGLWYWTDPRTARVSYRTVAIKRGDIGSTINTTGTIEPEEVVDVGCPGGRPDRELCPRPWRPEQDDQLRLAGRARGPCWPGSTARCFRRRLDQARGRVAKAEADIEQAQAKLRQADRELERCRKLKTRGTAVIAAQEFDEAVANDESAKAALAVTQAALAVARADLEEATVNLGYTTIRSPVKGIILDRRINIGQIVVASLNAPSLFLIAKDLSRLEIWSSVNETDIGSIHVGQKVHFTVSSLPHDTFEGKVSQIRLNASMTQNVVTYTVVIAVDNSERPSPAVPDGAACSSRSRRGKASCWCPTPLSAGSRSVQNIVPEAREDYARLPRPAAARAGRVRATVASTPDAAERCPLGPPGRFREADQDPHRPLRRPRHRDLRRRPRARAWRSSSVPTGSIPSPTPCQSCRIPGASLQRNKQLMIA